MEKIFDEPEYRLKPVPPEHPLWNAEEPVRPALRPNLWSDRLRLPHQRRLCCAAGAGQGRFAQRLVVLLGNCLRPRSQADAARLQEQLDAALSMGINVLAYATNRELKSKDENFQIADDTPKEPRHLRARQALHRQRAASRRLRFRSRGIAQFAARRQS